MHPLDSYKAKLQANLPTTHLFRGLAYSCLPAFPQGGLRLATYNALHRDLPLPIAVILSDLASSIVKVPRENVTLSQQTGLRRPLFSGFWASSARDWPFMILLFGLHDKLQEHSKSALNGALAGGIAGFLTSPIDLIRTRKADTYSETIKSMRKGGIWKGSLSRSVWWGCVCLVFFPMYEKLIELQEG